jgi:protein-S-isoprenylcysteine O-methyltransferase Ste14
MISGLNLSFLLAAIVLVFYTLNIYFMSRFDPQRQQTKKKGWGWRYTSQVMVMSALIIVQPVLWPSLSLTKFSVGGILLQSAGVALVIISLGLHIWARAHLGKFYVERVEVQPDHRVIDTGPYRFVRHPIITSFLGLAAGMLLINPAITTTLLLAYAIWDFTGSAVREEKLLSETVTGYKAYMDRVPRFLPHLRRIR